ncbi:DegT/DnrJ/EryC1/StrS family aminotransferase [Aquifex aeolicus]|uniref:Transcriptional regulator (DegT/DnrJ/Eryc1 family) n=1 Tax=Aquifex aeolicus (strain VF5) TaxID=224324 RepID=O67617_AQUAE|nr:DegT/DnrJ/EryC1/StrS family aminotransferase [Aquifex aeolicus]AAC07581.1 transcriptional regulator (DegT/DnrJ/Eryc1 family) [Aquifex aeolicus VF5]
MKIPIIGLEFSEEEKKALTEILESKRITRDGWTDTFQEAFAEFLNVKYCATVCSGTVALFIGLKALGIRNGEKVVIPAMSFMATIDAVLLAGGIPVVVDVDEYYTMDVNQLEDAVKKYRPRVVIPVHLYGQPADMENIMFLADRYGFFVLEDCAQAHGAEFKGKKVGAWGHLSAFSFYASKNVPMGEGGALTTNDESLFKEVKKWIDFGEHPAFNVKITEFQAAIGTLQLRKLKERNERRRNIARIYTENLKGLCEVPEEREGAYHVYHLYTLRHKERDRLVEHLRSKGIDARVYYTYLLHELRNAEALPTPKAERFKREVFSIPVHPFLKEEEVLYIIESLKEVL